ncbi:MAG TPA: exosortase-associated EpsI family protein [Gemmataceae bacterium]|nr:exosortase-associated EpsI family protein [Gemmataceae bacterium]
MSRLLIAGLGIAAVLLSGVVHGLWSGRWEWTDEPGASAARLSAVSCDLGDWQGEPLDDEGRPPDGAAGCLCRRYTNRWTGNAVTVYLLCGRPGPVALHPPDSCYGASGYEVGSPSKFSPPAEAGTPPAEFRVAQMRRKRAGEQTRLRIFWAWNDGQGWRVPADPRTEFAARRALFKLYLVRELADRDGPADADPSLDLMRRLLPELQRALFADG